MLNSELMNFVLGYSNGNLEIIYNLFKNDCKMDIEFYRYNIEDMVIGYFANITIINKKTLKKEKINIVNANDMLNNIFDNIDDETLKRLENIFLNRKNLFYRKNKDIYPAINLDVNNSNTNTNINNNSNTSNIETYSDLRSFVENNTTIDDNAKQEIVNIIKEIEKAKDKKDFKSYVDLYSKLLTSLQATLNISPFIIQGFEWLKNLF